VSGRRFAALLGAAVVLGASLFPVLWTLIGSLAPEEALFRSPALLPDRLVLDHYGDVLRERAFLIPIRNSLVVAGATTALCLVIGVAAAYALVRLRFRWKDVILAAILAVSMFPQIAIVSPLFLLLRGLGLINSFPGLVLPYLSFTLPLTVWLLTSFLSQLPWDLEDAAFLDGASRWRAFREIVLPLAMPGVASAGILTFVYCWNEFLFALAFTLGPDRQTVPVAITLFRGRYQIPWGQVLAASVLASLPIVGLVIGFQRRIVRGLTAGAVKG